MGERRGNNEGRFRIAPDGTTTIDQPVEDDAPPPEDDGNLEEMTFSTHVLSLHAMALMHLGELEGIETGDQDVDAARHVVDTLAMLVAKTQGNLSPEEGRLLEAILHELRLKCLDKSR